MLVEGILGMPRGLGRDPDSWEISLSEGKKWCFYVLGAAHHQVPAFKELAPATLRLLQTTTE